MAQGMYHYIQQAWKKPDAETLRQRMIEWRASPVFVKVDKPLRLDRARALGYKDKKGIVVVRIRVRRGGHKRPRPNKARRSKRMHTNKNLQLNYKTIAEQRTAKKYQNLEVLNSYQIGKDGMNYFYEVILVDPNLPVIVADKNINWICGSNQKGRAEKGLTSPGKRMRGLQA